MISITLFNFLNSQWLSYRENEQYTLNDIDIIMVLMFVCLWLTSQRQRGHLEKVSPFTVPCKGREAR